MTEEEKREEDEEAALEKEVYWLIKNLLKDAPEAEIRAMLEEWPAPMRVCVTLTDDAIEWLYEYRKFNKGKNNTAWQKYVFVPNSGWFVSSSYDCWYGPLIGQRYFAPITMQEFTDQYLPKWFCEKQSQMGRSRLLDYITPRTHGIDE